MRILKRFSDDGPVLMAPDYHSDERGYFYESFNQKWFNDNISDSVFCQDNQSFSKYGVLRGFHLQLPPFEQAKLVRVVKGAVIDVAVDIRKDSKDFGKAYQVLLTEANQFQFYIPRGFAHAFLACENGTVFQYKCDNFYAPQSERCIVWNDDTIGFDWTKYIDYESLIISSKDNKGCNLKTIADEREKSL